MTVPFERTQSLVQTKELLQRLQDPEVTSDVPTWLRVEAAALLNR